MHLSERKLYRHFQKRNFLQPLRRRRKNISLTFRKKVFATKIIKAFAQVPVQQTKLNSKILVIARRIFAKTDA